MTSIKRDGCFNSLVHDRSQSCGRNSRHAKVLATTRRLSDENSSCSVLLSGHCYCCAAFGRRSSGTSLKTRTLRLHDTNATPHKSRTLPTSTYLPASFHCIPPVPTMIPMFLTIPSVAFFVAFFVQSWFFEGLDPTAVQPVLKLDSADMTGIAEGSVHKFLGIPFAKAP